MTSLSITTQPQAKDLTPELGAEPKCSGSSSSSCSNSPGPHLTPLQLGQDAGIQLSHPRSCPSDTLSPAASRGSLQPTATRCGSYPTCQGLGTPGTGQHQPVKPNHFATSRGLTVSHGMGSSKRDRSMNQQPLYPIPLLPLKPDPTQAELMPALTGDPSYLNTAAASVGGCRARGTVASGTVQSQAAEGTPPKGCEAESALRNCRGWGRASRTVCGSSPLSTWKDSCLWGSSTASCRAAVPRNHWLGDLGQGKLKRHLWCPTTSPSCRSRT